MILPGKYDAVATEYQWGTSTNGKTQVAVCFQILEGPQSGQYITWYGYFTGKAEKITLKALRACGWKGDDLMQLGELDQRVSIVIENEEHEGKTHAKVQWVNAPGGGIALKNPLGNEELRMFAAKMKARAAESKEIAGERVEVDRADPPAARETYRHDEPPPQGDADIPF